MNIDGQNILTSHLPFVQKMLQKALGTAHEGKWRKLVDLINSSHKIAPDKIPLIEQTITSLEAKLKVFEEEFERSQDALESIVKTPPQSTETSPPNANKSSKKTPIKLFLSRKRLGLASPRREKIPKLKINLNEVKRMEILKREKKRIKKDKNRLKVLFKYKGVELKRELMSPPHVPHALENPANISAAAPIVQSPMNVGNTNDETLLLKYGIKECFVSLEKLNVNLAPKTPFKTPTLLEKLAANKSITIKPARNSFNATEESISPVIQASTPVQKSKPGPLSVKQKILERYSEASSVNSISPLQMSGVSVSTQNELQKNSSSLRSPLSNPTAKSVQNYQDARPLLRKMLLTPIRTVSSQNQPMTSAQKKSPRLNLRILPDMPIKREVESNIRTPPLVTIPNDIMLPSLQKRNEILLSADTTMRKLRPWLKSSTHQKQLNFCDEMLQNENCLESLYKCMGSRCGFYTNSPVLFHQHLRLHFEYQKDDAKNFCQCPYCDFKNENSYLEYINHIKESHGCTRYQCSYCFYRSYDYHIVTHTRQYHSLEPERTIKCKPIKDLNSKQELDQVWKNFFSVCRKIFCVVCKATFLNITHFQYHLNSHSTIPQSQCIKCREAIDKASIMKHLKECYGFGNYNCAFCVFGTDAIEDLKKHLANEHANKILFFFDRSLQNLTEGSEVSKQIVVKQLTFQLSRRWQMKNAIPSISDNAENVAKGLAPPVIKTETNDSSPILLN